jgi:GNAT superfamily N-acetyltransferase
MSLPAEAARPRLEGIEIRDDRALDTEAFADILERSGLAERRPVDDAARLAQMLAHANLLITAWEGSKLVGVARSMTDFAYFCYCSDLAVDKAYQGRGIGRALLNAAAERLHPKAKLYLASAPAAISFYERIGLTRLDNFFVMLPGQAL